MPTISTNKELLNVINDDVKSVKEWSNMPPISDELYAELVKEFNNERKYFFNIFNLRPSRFISDGRINADWRVTCKYFLSSMVSKF